MSVYTSRLHRQNAQSRFRLPAFPSRECVAEAFLVRSGRAIADADILPRDVLSFNVVKNSGTLADQVGRRRLSTSQADAARDAAAGSLE